MKPLKAVLSVLFVLVVLVAAFVGVVIITRPTPVQAPPDGVHSVKILSAQPIDFKTYFGYDGDGKDWWFYSLRLQQIDKPQGTVAPVFEWRFANVKDENEHCTPVVGKVVEYNSSRGLSWFDAEGDYCDGMGYPAPAPDPLPWFHNKENSLGLAVLGGIAFLVLVALVIGIVGWLAPIYIAKKRGHPNFMPIAVITILLGWTFIGWAVCLAWSLSSIKKSQDAFPELVAK